MVMLSSFLALSFAFVHVEAAIGPTGTLNIVNKVIAPDGFNRSTVLAGGTFPGAMIHGKKGDHFQLNVVNQLSDASMARDTSIHWHGLFQKGTNWADGVSMVNQCPIVPQESFLYDFSVPDQAGTFWYHSHVGTQYCDGLRGPFIIYDDQDPHQSLYDVDDESTVLMLGDWYHLPSPQVTGIPHPDATVFNGLGRSLNGPASPLYVQNVAFGTRYRLRLINAGCDSNYVFSIDGHTFTIIEADGQNTEPLQVDQLQIFPGQRYSIVLNANQTVGNYWIRANPSTGDPGFDNNMNSAILRYQGAPIAEPSTVETTPANPLFEYNLHALADAAAPGKPVPGGADVNINLDIVFDDVNILWKINGVSWVAPTVPVLLQIMSGTYDVHDLAPTGSIYDIEAGQVVELTMPAVAIFGPHPIHLHGHAFSVVRSAGSSNYNFVNPVRRDVVSIGLPSDNDNVTIRFVADNAGPWFLHCHIDWHLDVGFAVAFAEAAAQTPQANPVPSGNASHTPALLVKIGIIGP
ncbi:hypothetical protein ONZ45_g8915 [Pleurotus djamor]|nr:hypothetical protein ONZ45_g8915 [Pleurotus djamor]